MWRIVIRTLVHEGVRALLAVVAVAGAITLILVFEGFRVGLYRQVRALPASLPADLVATQSGVSNMLGARSVIPQGTRQRIEAITGVKAVHPLGGIPVIYSQGGRASPIYVVAYDTAGGPRRLVAGHEISALGEIVVDAALARRYRLDPGDQVEFLGYRFTIAGLSADTTNFFDPYVFVRLIDLVDLYMAGDLPGDLPLEAATSFLLVELEPKADRGTVCATIEHAVESIDLFTPQELAESDVHRAASFMGPPLDLLVAIAYLVGILVVGLTLYGSVAGRARELVVMKAIGARTPRLAQAVLGEALIVSILGMVVATGMSQLLAALIGLAMPGYLVEPLEPGVVGRTAAATLVIACLGTLLPLRRVVSIDPALAFR